MPNEVWNKLTVSGPEADVQCSVERVVSDELDHMGQPYLLDFSTHVPVAAETTLAFEHEWMEEFAQSYGRRRYEAGPLVRDDDIAPPDLDWVTWDEDDG